MSEKKEVQEQEPIRSSEQPETTQPQFELIALTQQELVYLFNAFSNTQIRAGEAQIAMTIMNRLQNPVTSQIKRIPKESTEEEPNTPEE